MLKPFFALLIFIFTIFFHNRCEPRFRNPEPSKKAQLRNLAKPAINRKFGVPAVLGVHCPRPLPTGNLSCLAVQGCQDCYQQEILLACCIGLPRPLITGNLTCLRYWVVTRLLPTGNCWLACGIGFPQNSYQQEFFWLACGNGLPRDFSQQEIFGVPAVFGCQVILKGFYPIVSEKHNSCEA